MKALVMVGLVTMSSIALANGGGGGGGGGGNPTTQTSVIMHTSVWNTSDGSGSASEQNLASNAGTFTNSNTHLFRMTATAVVVQRKILLQMRVPRACIQRHTNLPLLLIQA